MNVYTLYDTHRLNFYVQIFSKILVLQFFFFDSISLMVQHAINEVCKVFDAIIIWE